MANQQTSCVHTATQEEGFNNVASWPRVSSPREWKGKRASVLAFSKCRYVCLVQWMKLAQVKVQA